MVKMKFSPCGEEAAKGNENSFFKEIARDFKGFDKEFAEETGLNKAQRLGVAVGVTTIGAALYTAGWAGGAGVVSFAGIMAGGMGAMGVVYHAKDTKLAKAFVAGSKAFNKEMSPVYGKVGKFFGTAKKHIIAATRKEPTFEVNGQVVNQDKRSMPRRIFDYVKAMRTK